MYTVYALGPQRPEGGIKSPETDVTNHCEHHVGAGTKLECSARQQVLLTSTTKPSLQPKETLPCN